METIRTYRTVSSKTAFLLAGMPLVYLRREPGLRPGYLSTHFRGHLLFPRRKLRNFERKTTIVEWHKRWTHTDKAAWTRRLIPDIIRWENRTTPIWEVISHDTGTFYLPVIGAYSSTYTTLSGPLARAACTARVSQTQRNTQSSTVRTGIASAQSSASAWNPPSFLPARS